MATNDTSIPVDPPRTFDHPLIEGDQKGARSVLLLLTLPTLGGLLALAMGVSTSKKTHVFGDPFVVIVAAAERREQPGGESGTNLTGSSISKSLFASIRFVLASRAR